MTSHFALLLVLRTVAGLTGALAFVAGAGLTSAAAAGGQQESRTDRSRYLFCRRRIGCDRLALAVPPLLSAMGWRGGWLALGGCRC